MNVLKRELNLILMIVGVALAAAGGIQLGEADFNRASDQGKAALLAAESANDKDKVREQVDPSSRLSEWTSVGSLHFVAGLVLIVAGAVGTRRQEKQEATELRDHNDLDLASALTTMIRDVESLRERLNEAPVPRQEVLDGIERLQVEQLDPLLANRHALEMRYGLVGFASLVGPLSSAERFLNRAWTTLVDHYAEESADSLQQALMALKTVNSEYEVLETA